MRQPHLKTRVSRELPSASDVQTSEDEIVCRVGNLVQHGFSSRSWSKFLFLLRNLPSRVQQLGKVNESKSLRRTTSSGEMKDDLRLHRREQRVSGAGLAMVQEIGLIYTTILGLGCGFPDNPKNGISSCFPP